MSALTGAPTLVRLMLRRDRVLLPLWILLVPVGLLLQPSATRELFPTPAQLQGYAGTLRTPALTALYGPVFDSNVGAVSVTRAGFVPVIIALVALLTVIRHTRTEEEAGRRELVGASVVGRHAGLAGTLLVTVVASLLLGAYVAAVMTSQDLPVGGSIAVGCAYAAVGCMFAAVGAVAAQLTQGAGAARGVGMSGLGVAFALRLTGDVSGAGGLSWLSWLSPIGWSQQVRPYADERWWVIGLMVGFTALTAIAAVALSARRDVGAGLVPPRAGSVRAAPALRHPLALGWRLHRGSLLAWSLGFALFGIVNGAATDGLEDLFRDNPQLEELLLRLGGQQMVVDAWLAGILGFFAILASGFAIGAALHLRSEEVGRRAEPLLATAITRVQWAASHVAFAVLGPVALLAVGGLAIGFAHGLVAGDVSGQVPRALGAAIVHLPAVWVLAGVAVAAFGLLPALNAAVGWGALASFFLLGQVGSVLQLDQWMLNLSPFTHVPRLPGAELELVPVIALTITALALTGLGLTAFRYRDLDTR